MQLRCFRSLTCLLVSLPLLFGSLHAANFKVDCDNKHPKKSSISEALTKLSPGPNTITVSGTCKENVLIQGIDDLTLVATPGASIVDQSNNTITTVQIEHSRRFSLIGFEVVGGNFDGILCTLASDCAITNNNVHDAGTGIFAYEGSTAILSGNHVHNCGGGVGALSSSYLHLLGGPFGAPNIIENNQGVGMILYDGSSARVEGITANGTASLNPNIISNNGGGGVNVTFSTVTLFGTVLNGNGNSLNPNNLNSTGVTLIHSGARMVSPQITGNYGPGLLLTDASHTQISGATITGNSRNGVVLLLQSTAYFGGPVNTVAGNGTANPDHVDLFCDATAWLQNPNNIAVGTGTCAPNQVNGNGPVP